MGERQGAHNPYYYNSLYCSFAVIYYDASVEPSEVQIVAHKNAKDKEKPMPRTKRSILQKERQLLTSNTPLQVCYFGLFVNISDHASILVFDRSGKK